MHPHANFEHIHTYKKKLRNDAAENVSNEKNIISEVFKYVQYNGFIVVFVVVSDAAAAAVFSLWLLFWLTHLIKKNSKKRRHTDNFLVIFG